MKFSICIPNYNYERFLGRTIRSVLDQSEDDFEIVVSDNASTDRSVEVAHSFGDPRIRVAVNETNLGFARNLDCAAQMARGDYLIMLSSDDLMRPEALAEYRRLLDDLADAGPATVITSDAEMIDADDAVTGPLGLPRRNVWRETDRSPPLEQNRDGAVYRVEAIELLRRSLPYLQNPLHFLSTCYSRRLYLQTGGYGGNRLMNPDKWFHWKLLGKASQVCYLRSPLFAYRWHSGNQTAQQREAGALKFLVDDYTSTFEYDAAQLQAVGLTRADLERAFIEYDIVRHGLAEAAEGRRRQARRIWHFGYAAYPRHMRFRAGAYLLWLISRMGPAGTWIAARLRKKYAGQAATPTTSATTSPAVTGGCPDRVTMTTTER